MIYIATPEFEAAARLAAPGDEVPFIAAPARTASRRDPRIRRSCPFCGEAVHLNMQDGGGIWPIIMVGETITAAECIEYLQEVDAVYCEVCQANAPVIVWNHEVPADVMAVLRDIDPPVAALEAA